MASFSTSFIGSASSAGASVRDAIESYRRAQFLVAGSTVAATTQDYEDVGDVESGDFSTRESIQDEHDNVEEGNEEDPSTPTLSNTRDEFVGQLNWDEDYEASLRRESQPASYQSTSLLSRQVPPMLPSGSRQMREDTPLLRKISFSEPQAPPPRPRAVPRIYTAPDGLLAPPEDHERPRRMSTTSIASSRALRYQFGGKSTFGQTLFNSIAILLGIGMLSEPLAFAYSGWIVGTGLIILYGSVACYTAKVLAHIILADPRVRSYSDIGRKAFGPRATPIISFMFCLELFAVSVVLVTLYGDSLHSLLPERSSDTYKIWGLLILLPTVFLPLSLLSYTSILGIISSFLVIAVILIDGFTKTTAPGSLWEPAKTDMGAESLKHLGLAYGLFMAGFAGHAVIPSLARDMQDPSEFDRMINWAFVIATSFYALIGGAGYLMFGNDVSDEFSVDLMKTPGYNPTLNRLCLWMLVISPLSKFGLNTQPLNATLEILLGIDTPLSAPEDVVDKPDGLDVSPEGTRFGWKLVPGIIQRIVLTSLSVYVSISVPEFSSMMAFLGSFSAFMISIVGPVLAKVAIHRECGLFDFLVIAVGTVMAIWGVTAAVISA